MDNKSNTQKIGLRKPLNYAGFRAGTGQIRLGPRKGLFGGPGNLQNKSNGEKDEGSSRNTAHASPTLQPKESNAWSTKNEKKQNSTPSRNGNEDNVSKPSSSCKKKGSERFQKAEGNVDAPHSSNKACPEPSNDSLTSGSGSSKSRVSFKNLEGADITRTISRRQTMTYTLPPPMTSNGIRQKSSGKGDQLDQEEHEKKDRSSPHPARPPTIPANFASFNLNTNREKSIEKDNAQNPTQPKSKNGLKAEKNSSRSKNKEGGNPRRAQNIRDEPRRSNEKKRYSSRDKPGHEKVPGSDKNRKSLTKRGSGSAIVLKSADGLRLSGKVRTAPSSDSPASKIKIVTSNAQMTHKLSKSPGITRESSTRQNTTFTLPPPMTSNGIRQKSPGKGDQLDKEKYEKKNDSSSPHPARPSTIPVNLTSFNLNANREKSIAKGNALNPTQPKSKNGLKAEKHSSRSKNKVGGNPRREQNIRDEPRRSNEKKRDSSRDKPGHKKVPGSDKNRKSRTKRGSGSTTVHNSAERRLSKTLKEQNPSPYVQSALPSLLERNSVFLQGSGISVPKSRSSDGNYSVPSHLGSIRRSGCSSAGRIPNIGSPAPPDTGNEESSGTGHRRGDDRKAGRKRILLNIETMKRLNFTFY